MERSKISKVISIILGIMLIGGLVCLFGLSNLYDYFRGSDVIEFGKHSIFYQGAFYLCYIVSLLIIFEVNRVFSSVYKEGPFKKCIERSLKVIAVLFMVLSVIVFVKCIFIPTLLSMAVTLITFIASLSFYVLSQVIKASIVYKEEVDYTV